MDRKESVELMIRVLGQHSLKNLFNTIISFLDLEDMQQM